MRPAALLRAGSVIVLIAAAPALGAQADPRPQPLRGTTIELAEPMTLITGLHPLPDGRVVAVDAAEKAIRIVDFTAGTATPIGREGRGPNEYLAPRTTIGWSGDTVLVYDGGERKLLKITPLGALAGEIAIPGSLFMNRGVTPPRWSSERGDIYFEIEPLDFLRDQHAPRRAIITRWTPGTELLDSVAALMTHEPGRPTRGIARFLRHDAWGVAPDGRLGIARALDYHVEWHRAGEAPRVGATVAYPPVPVTASEREAVEESARSGPRQTASMSGGTSEGSSSTRRTPGRPPAAVDYPATKPPFEARDRLGRPSVLATGAGELWVTRNRAWNDSIPIVDVFDDRARLARRVQLPPHTRVLHVDGDTVYLARRDVDDLEWLVRVNP